jgi:hypothetical protein
MHVVRLSDTCTVLSSVKACNVTCWLKLQQQRGVLVYMCEFGDANSAYCVVRIGWYESMLCLALTLGSRIYSGKR